MLVGDQTILGIDATGQTIAVGLSQSGVNRAAFFLNNGNPSSETLLSSIDHLLNSCDIDKNELQGICLTTGPGSFTSMRISLSTAQAMGFGLNIPIYDTNSLVLIAGTLPYYPHPIWIIKNAYKGELYGAAYDTTQGKPIELESLHLITPQQFIAKVEPHQMILGDTHLLHSHLTDLKSKNIVLNQSINRTPSGLSVIEHFADHPVKKPSEIPLEPIYIRLSEAEINYKKQFGTS